MMRDVIRKVRWTLAGSIAALALGITPVAHAADTINVPNVTLLPNTPNQLVTITITGNSQVAGEDFYAQIGDGGTFNHGVNTKPIFTNVDIVTGTIFALNHTDPTRDPNGPESDHPLIWVDGITTNSGTVADGGLLATLTIDTTGVDSGTYPLLLSGVASGLSPGGFTTRLVELNGGNPQAIPLTINNGSITVANTPEPASLGLVAGTMGFMLSRRRRR